MNATRWMFLIPILPLAGAMLNGFVGRRLPRSLVALVACGGPIASFCLAVLWFFELRSSGDELVNWLGDWFALAGLDVPFGFRLDNLSAVMAVMITGVGSLIHVYSVGYMSKDAGYARYFTYLNLFMGSMLILVLADNIVLLFLGWEGVGLCSYLLIGFWYEDEANARAGKKAFIVNRIGDFGFLLGILLIYVTHGTFDLRQINTDAAGGVVSASGLAISDVAKLWIPLLLFIGATGKSAQIPLHVWLPDAMAGPTPVSALIHAATMVTSGVYMVARLGAVYSAAPSVMLVVAVIGVVTALVAGFIAMSQYDIKKVLAYSTVSQLGYMFLAAGLGAYGIAIFHLVTHAFFKGLLFLGAGAVIHSLHHEQDMRRMGGLRKELPVTFALMLIGTLAIAGCPLLAGFYSKDAILEQAMEKNLILWAIGAATAVLTSFYMFRLLAMTFLGERRGAGAHAGDHAPGGHHDDHHAHAGPVKEAPAVMLAPMAVLAGLSICGGIVFHDLPAFVDSAHVAAHGVLGALVSPSGLLGTVFFLGGAWAAWFFFVKSPATREAVASRNPAGRVLWRFSHGKLFVDELYDALVVRPLDVLSQIFYLLVDRLLIDVVLVSGTSFCARVVGSTLRLLQTGRVPTYAGWLVGGAVVLLIVIFMVLNGR